ncbi:hypothetical protein CANCADRAFT_2883 [Tortispora caseinolytica NRRL Y-17796]|uniref:Uncharacterized protein n=1 Tax=Tortispora caseinolytica NRRL Y-17796 TaxID=767744 RepID=A0A1E4THE4_9ASCO|nr:hypothetical protein CANCADRAFT_2883 [Tortispora caseinolytica NRRL Y-17796]
MVKLKATEAIIKLTGNHDNYIEHKELFEICKKNNVNFDEIVRGSDIYLPPKPTPLVNEEHRERMRMLKIQLEEKEYQQMINSKEQEPLYENIKETKHEISIIINILVSTASVVVGVWTWAKHWRTGERLLLAMLSGIIIIIAEVAVYMGYIRKIKEAREIERRKREKVKVVKSYKFKPKTS